MLEGIKKGCRVEVFGNPLNNTYSLGLGIVNDVIYTFPDKTYCTITLDSGRVSNYFINNSK